MLGLVARSQQVARPQTYFSGHRQPPSTPVHTLGGEHHLLTSQIWWRGDMSVSRGEFCCKSALKGHRTVGGPEEVQSALEQYYLACANEFEHQHSSLFFHTGSSCGAQQ
jgi:hypothetical protein